MGTQETTLLLSFYFGSGSDHMGRSLNEVLEQDDQWLEQTHDYIQWLFPLYVGSKFNTCAPLLTDEVREAFIDSEYPDNIELQANFSLAIQRMLSFYGYSVSLGENHKISPSSDWEQRSKNWLTSNNHNHLRLTRMLRSITLLGQKTLAFSFYHLLINEAQNHPSQISPRTLDFWKEAVKLPAI